MALKIAQWEVSEPVSASSDVLARFIKQPAPIADAPPTGIVITIRVETAAEVARLNLSMKVAMLPSGVKPPIVALGHAISSALGGNHGVAAIQADPKESDAPPAGVLRLIVGPKS
jgi:hypothetical protein